MSENPTEGTTEDPETTTGEGGGLTQEEKDNLWLRTLDH
jgi:hypothetical protein